MNIFLTFVTTGQPRNYTGHGLTLSEKILLYLKECDGEDGRAVNSETKGCGFYPHMGHILVALFNFFFHSHIHKI